MAEWLPLIAFDDIQTGKINKVEALGTKMILLLIEGNVFLYDDACPHEGHPLSLGELEGDILTCAKHLWEFDVRTGKHISRINRPECDLRPFSARVFDGVVEIALPDA